MREIDGACQLYVPTTPGQINMPYLLRVHVFFVFAEVALHFAFLFLQSVRDKYSKGHGEGMSKMVSSTVQ